MRAAATPEAKGTDMAAILDRIREPADLRKLSEVELSTLAMEVRGLILDTVAKNGGHLGSNLGVVELTLALHQAFDSPRDKIVWDVGHQCYAHKLLTGRRRPLPGAAPAAAASRASLPRGERARRLRHRPRLHLHLGRPRHGRGPRQGRREAPRRRRHRRRRLTGGVALEGLNQAGHLGERLIIVLNDNEMSISHQRRGLVEVLLLPRLGPALQPDEGPGQVAPAPPARLGDAVIKCGRALEELVKKSLFPGLRVRGARLPLHRADRRPQHPVARRGLRDGQDLRGPVLVHVRDPEGQGLPAGRGGTPRFHGAGAVQGRDRRAPQPRVAARRTPRSSARP